MVQHQSGFVRNAIVLGLLTALGPFAIDMYLPSLPSIGASLGADPDATLMSLTAFFITFAFGQLVYGPISDMAGRKAPLYVGIAIFALASIGCAFAPNIAVLIALRAVQGAGGAAGMVVARAIVRDLHSGVDEARLLSLLMLVFSVSPLFAPMVGSFLIELASWRAVFWFVTVAAAIGLLLVAFFIRETRPAAARTDSNLVSALYACRLLLTDRKFLGLAFVGAFAIAGFFVFLSNSSFVLMGRHHLSSMQYSLAFSVNAAAFFAASQLNGWLGQRYGLESLVRPAMFGYAGAIALLFVLTLAGFDNLILLIALLFVSNGFLGLVIPVTSVLALAEHGPIAGTASSLLATLQLVTGSAMMALTGAFADGSTMRMVAGIAACALVSFVLTQLTFGGRRRQLQTETPSA